MLIRFIKLFVYAFLSLLHMSFAEDSTIYNVVPHHQFCDGKHHYHTLLIDQAKNALYVGGMNYVYRLLLTNINDTRSNAFYSRQRLPLVGGVCIEGYLPHRKCRNHVRTLLKTPSKPDELFVCGTNAFRPRLYQLNADNFSIISNVTGIPICGPYPTHNTTAVFVESGNPFPGPFIYGGGIVRHHRPPTAIYRREIDNIIDNYMTTAKDKNYWLNRAQFVGSFDLGGQYIYYFFREHAVEITSVKAVYSRVARVCKNDIGGSQRNGHIFTWSTFLKARIKCSIPGEAPFYFDHIQSVDYIRVERQVLFYATFTATPGGFSVSAVCVFSLNNIDNVLDHGDFMDTEEHQWRRLYEIPRGMSRPGQCGTASNYNYTMLHDAVQGIAPTPLFYKEDILLTQIAVDCGLAQDPRRCVVFAADTSGRLYKLSHNHADTSEQNSLLATYQLPQHSRVNAMKIWHTFLYIAQSSVVSQIPVDHVEVKVPCSRYRLFSACTADSHCSWDTQVGYCSFDCPHKTI